MLTRILLILLVLAAPALTACSRSVVENQEEVFVVLIPPRFDHAFSSGENQCMFREFLFARQSKVEPAVVCRGAGDVNDDSLLNVALKDDGSLTLNSMNYGNLSNTDVLTDRLKELFANRKQNRVMEPNSERAVKATGVKIPQTAKYGDLITVIRAVRDGGADPIVLLLNDRLPYELIEYPPKTKVGRQIQQLRREPKSAENSQ